MGFKQPVRELTPELTRERVKYSAGEARAIRKSFVGFNDRWTAGEMFLDVAPVMACQRFGVRARNGV